MRLSADEVDGIIKALTQFMDLTKSRLLLFGSRADRTLKGGDIDLLLIVNDSKQRDHLLTNKHHILARMKQLIGEQKIDLLIVDTIQATTDPFIQATLLKAIAIPTF